MLVHLNIDIWKAKDSKDIYIKGKPENVDVEFIKAGTPIEHTEDGLFIRRIKDDKIIFGPSCLPVIERVSYWKWEGLAARSVLKRSR